MAKKLKRFNGTTWDNIDILASDSELLGGLALNSSTTNNQANKITRTNASGEIHFGLIKTTVGTTSSGSTNVFIDTGDGFIRKKPLSSFISELNIQNDTNNYLTGVSGSGNGTVTFARKDLSSLTWNASHTHSNYLTSVPTASASVLGGIKVGSRLSISNGVLSANSQTDNNFTTILKNKLEGIASGATNVTESTVSGWGFTKNTGTVTGSGSASRLAYWTGENTLDVLGTATYPSLTELSYVKGVTSAIQTQLNGKSNSGHNHTHIYAQDNSLTLGSSAPLFFDDAKGEVYTVIHEGNMSTSANVYNSTRWNNKRLRVGSYTSGASGYITMGY